MEREHGQKSGMQHSGVSGLAISRDAWLAHVAGDHELHFHGQDGDTLLASWNGREAVFCHRYGLLTAPADDSAALGKLDHIARSSSEGSGRSSSSGRRCISRGRAAALIGVAGLIAFSLGKAWLAQLHVSDPALVSVPLWVVFCARTLLTTGATAVIASGGLALSCMMSCKVRGPR